MDMRALVLADDDGEWYAILARNILLVAVTEGRIKVYLTTRKSEGEADWVVAPRSTANEARVGAFARGE